MVGGHSSFDQDKNRLAEYETESTEYSEKQGGGTDCYNSKTGEFLGRTPSSWRKLTSFFVLFSAIVAVIWGLCMGIFFQTLDFYIPKFTQQSSLLWEDPGLGFRPAGGLGYQTKTGQYKGYSIYSSLIWFRHGGDGNYDRLRANLDKYLEEYEPGFFANQGASLTKCDFESKPITKDESCEFNKEWLSDAGSDIKCISSEYYGYNYGRPCILLKMNRVYDWRPIPYDIEEIRNHTTMPKKLKSDIERIWEEKCGDRSWGEDGLDPCPYLNMVWLHCDGETDADKENIGPVTYTPYRGFPGYYFPYRNQRGYLSPIVMVQLKNPTPAVLMNIECTAWARNIRHNRLKKSGMVHFELLMD